MTDSGAFSVATMPPVERARLVRLCARLVGDVTVAEDLAQETLIEAWRHEARLHDLAGRGAWLAAIARNVCRRWLRRQGRERARMVRPTPVQERDQRQVLEDLAGADTLEADLERAELAMLLDRALALLPPVSRQILVARYLEETPQAEVAVRLGLSEGAVAVRLHRGKLALRRVLATELREVATEYGLPMADPSVAAVETEAARIAGWRTTRLWCSICGQHRLVIRAFPRTGECMVRCPHCSAAPDDNLFQAVRPEAFRGGGGDGILLDRLMTLADGYYRAALASGTAACPTCGAPARLRRRPPDGVPVGWCRERGLHLYCEVCGAPTSWVTVRSLALSSPAGRRFWRAQSRIRSLPLREVTLAGRPALLQAFASMTGTAQLEVMLADDTYEVLAVHGARDA
ncbi:MAG: RNA polymerase sigma factor [Chloroflexota bacterium]|nr:RNA polymerase sigma factor [Chloroflexota bacterium]